MRKCYPNENEPYPHEQVLANVDATGPPVLTEPGASVSSSPEPSLVDHVSPIWLG